MNRLASLTLEQLENWSTQAIALAQTGHLPSYIPRLREAAPCSFALQIESIEAQTLSVGDRSLHFPLMSVVKPFLLLYLLSSVGSEQVFQQVGVEPSSLPFNSLTQLQIDQGWPRNPMINSGAIALAALLPGADASSRCETLRCWLNQNGNCHLVLDELMLASVQSMPNPQNQALAQELAAKGYLEADIALDTYNHLCCLAGTIEDLARLGILLVQCSSPLFSEYCRTVKALMTTCGLYQASGRMAVRVGLPTKSGVSGAVLSVVPRQGAIACYSPPLDKEGNSVAGLFIVEQVAHAFKLSIFD